jgi:hypothetical protein
MYDIERNTSGMYGIICYAYVDPILEAIMTQRSILS